MINDFMIESPTFNNYLLKCCDPVRQILTILCNPVIRFLSFFSDMWPAYTSDKNNGCMQQKPNTKSHKYSCIIGFLQAFLIHFLHRLLAKRNAGECCRHCLQNYKTCLLFCKLSPAVPQAFRPFCSYQESCLVVIFLFKEDKPHDNRQLERFDLQNFSLKLLLVVFSNVSGSDWAWFLFLFSLVD